jgi:hypothetical protein
MSGRPDCALPAQATALAIPHSDTLSVLGVPVTDVTMEHALSLLHGQQQQHPPRAHGI